MRALFAAALIVLVTAQASYATCIYGGASYGTGAKVNGQMCMADGSWL